MNIQDMTPKQQRELAAQLAVIKQEGLAKYVKGDLLVDDITKNKGGGMTIRFKESGFPINVTKKTLEQIIKHGDILVQAAIDLDIK